MQKLCSFCLHSANLKTQGDQHFNEQEFGEMPTIPRKGDTKIELFNHE